MAARTFLRLVRALPSLPPDLSFHSMRAAALHRRNAPRHLSKRHPFRIISPSLTDMSSAKGIRPRRPPALSIEGGVRGEAE
eukprot:scaffold34966_cov30-Tisochrysis_lutea.AAC.2